MKLSVGIDIDGVLADFEGAFVEAFGDQNRHIYNLYGRYPDVDKDIITEFVTNPVIYQDLEPIFGGMVLLNSVRAHGRGVVLITSRPLSCQEETKKWLDRYSVEYDGLVFSENKNESIWRWNKSSDNVIYCMVDDSIGALTGISSAIMGYVWSQPWNFGFVPRMMYNSDTMSIQVKEDLGSDWEPFWKD